LDQEAVKISLFAALLLALPPSCGLSNETPPDPANVPGSVTLTGPSITAKPQVLVTALPVSAFSDAGLGAEDKTVFQQAKEYHERGQNWVARLLIEKIALGANGTKDEAELLLDICKAQGDGACVQDCARKLGRKIAFDAGAPLAPPTTPLPPTSAERPLADTPFTKARDLHLKKRDKEARALLEPRLLDGKAAPEETRLLLEICNAQKDRMCVALCNKQLGL